jgi:hypothetical protein
MFGPFQDLLSGHNVKISGAAFCVRWIFLLCGIFNMPLPLQ